MVYILLIKTDYSEILFDQKKLLRGGSWKKLFLKFWKTKGDN